MSSDIRCTCGHSAAEHDPDTYCWGDEGTCRCACTPMEVTGQQKPSELWDFLPDMAHDGNGRAIAQALLVVADEIRNLADRAPERGRGVSGGGLVEVLAAHEYRDVRGDYEMAPFYKHFGCSCGWEQSIDGMSGWRSWVGAHRKHLADVVTAHLAARLEGCREEVRGVVLSAVVMDSFATEGDDLSGLTENALAAVRWSALGLPPETQRATLRASDDADGPEGHHRSTRAGDGM